MPAAAKRKAATKAAKPEAELAPDQLVMRILKARAAGARQYSKADDALRKLRAKVQCEPVALGPEHDRELQRLLGEKKFSKLGPKKQAVINDVYATDEKVYRSHGIARYELDIEAAA